MVIFDNINNKVYDNLKNEIKKGVKYLSLLLTFQFMLIKN